MPAAIDTSKVVSTSGSSTGPFTVNCTCGVSDNALLVFVASDSSTAQGPPSGITYNGTALTLIDHQSLTSNYRGDVSVWWLNNLTGLTGSSLPLVATAANSQAGFAMTAIPMSGVKTGTTPTTAKSSAGSGTTASVSTPAAASTDMQMAAMWIRGSAVTDGGGAQTIIPSTPTLPLLSIAGLDSYSADYITGPTAGNFSWTFTSNNWIALGVTVFGTAAGPLYITKWTPFRWACAMRSLQQGANNVGNRQQNRLALLASAITNANGAATWAKWRVGENSRVSSCGLMLNVPLVPGFVPPVGTVDDGT